MNATLITDVAGSGMPTPVFACCTPHLGKAMRFLVLNAEPRFIRVVRIVKRDDMFSCECGKTASWYLKLMREVSETATTKLAYNSSYNSDTPLPPCVSP